MKRTPLAERLERHIDRNGPVPEARPDLGPCWLWTGSLTTRGYGQIAAQIDGRWKLVPAHVAMYETHVGPIPDGLELDHLCRVRPCCRPSHTEPVTRRVNQLRGDTIGARNAAKTHCPRGHQFTADNIYWTGPDRRWRSCRTCRIERERSKRAAA